MLLIVGTRSRKVKVDGGIVRGQHCSKCGSMQIFEEVKWINHFCLFLVPLFPIQSNKSVESVLACPTCNTSYEI